MPELNIYDTLVLLFGAPTSFGGVILLYVLAIIVTVIIGIWGFCFALIMLRKLVR